MRSFCGRGTTATLVAVAVGAVTALGTATPASAVSALSTQPVAPVAHATAAGPAAPGGSKCQTTAAKAFDWGQPTRHSDFDGTTVPPDWHPYGPEPGHNKKGERTPEAVTVGGGAMSITGTEDGTTGAVSWHPGQKYGRWEACVRADEGAGGLNALLLLWPNAEDFPVGGEIDWMENMSADRQKTNFFLHYGANNDQEVGSVSHDGTEWTAWALEWTPDKMTGFVNGKPWFESTDSDHFPPRPMNMTMQLDYFPPAGGPSAMHMDWASQWALPESEPATLSLPPGAPATGQPRDYPDRKPRAIDGAAPQESGAGTSEDPGEGEKKRGGDEGTVEPSGAVATTDPATRPRLLHPTGSPATEPAATGQRPRELHATG